MDGESGDDEGDEVRCERTGSGRDNTGDDGADEMNPEVDSKETYIVSDRILVH